MKTDTYHRIWLVNVEGVEVEPDLADVIRDLADGHGAGRGDGASALQKASIFANAFTVCVEKMVCFFTNPLQPISRLHIAAKTQ